MRITWKRLAPKETDHELLWLGVSLAGFFAAAIWRAAGMPWPNCFFHSVTGLPCLTCGATRASVAFFHGDFFTAWNWNPLVFLALCGIALFDAYAAVVLVMRAPRLRFDLSRFDGRMIRLVAICLLALSWIYSLGHWRDF